MMVMLDIATINLVWSAGNLGYMAGCLLAGAVYTRWLPTQRAKAGRCTAN